MEITTDGLALWGAITGTAGTIAGVANLAIRYKQHRNDRAILSCVPHFEFEFENGVPAHASYIKIRSIGRRPLTIDSVVCFFAPTSSFDLVFPSRLWRKGKFTRTLRLPDAIKLGEGESTSVGLQWVAKKLGVPTVDILRIEIHDGAGRAWNVEWPSRRKLESLTHIEKLFESQQRSETNQRSCNILTHKAGSKFYIHIQCNESSGRQPTKHSLICFASEDEYTSRLAKIVGIECPQFLETEIDEIK